jgi:hypothetical protein
MMIAAVSNTTRRIMPSLSTGAEWKLPLCLQGSGSPHAKWSFITAATPCGLSCFKLHKLNFSLLLVMILADGGVVLRMLVMWGGEVEQEGTILRLR